MNNTLITTSRFIAIMSFAIGTIIFIAQLLFFEPGALFAFGLAFVIIALCINTIFALALIGDMFLRRELLVPLFQTLCIVLLNIPVALVYMIIVFNQIGVNLY